MAGRQTRREGRRCRLGGRIVLALAAALPAPACALTPEGGLAGAAVAGIVTIGTPVNLLALALAGLWLGLARAPDAGWSRAGVVGAASAGAGFAAGLAMRAPSGLDAMIAWAACATALRMAIGVRRPWLAKLPLAAVAALFGLGVGSVLGSGGLPAGVVAAYLAAMVAPAVAVVTAGTAIGLRLRGRSLGVIRGLGVWGLALGGLLALNGAVERPSGLDGSTDALRVDGTELAEEEIPVLVTSLLEQVYLAFERSDEGEIYDALAAVAEGDVLTDLYLQKRAVLALDADEGKRSDLRAVEVERVTAARLPGEPGYRVHGLWRVEGTVIHWGHVHDRVNRYEADLAIVPVDGMWKIAAFDLLDVVREDPPL